MWTVHTCRCSVACDVADVTCVQDKQEYTQSYELMDSWCKEFKRINPGDSLVTTCVPVTLSDAPVSCLTCRVEIHTHATGSVAEVDRDADNVFRGLTVGILQPATRLTRCDVGCFASDGAFFKHRWFRPGQLLSTTGRDGNNQNVTPLIRIAAAAGETKHDYNALFKATKDLVDPDPLVHPENPTPKTLFKAINDVESLHHADGSEIISSEFTRTFPDCQEKRCVFHHIKAARTKKKGPSWHDNLAWACASAETKDEYDAALSRFHQVNADAALYFDNLDHDKWTTYRANIMRHKTLAIRTNNAAEQFNAKALLCGIRDSHPLHAAHKYVLQTTEDLGRVREQITKWKSAGKLLTAYAEKRYLEQEDLALNCTCVPIDDTIYAVTYHKSQNDNHVREVDWSAKTCTCGEWTRYGIACRHGIKVGKQVAREKGWGKQRLLRELCMPGFLLTNYEKACSGSIRVPDMSSLQRQPGALYAPPIAAQGPGKRQNKRKQAGGLAVGTSKRQRGRPSQAAVEV